MLKGSKHTKETREKIGAATSKALTGRKLTQEHKDKIGKKSIGRIWCKDRRSNYEEAIYQKRMSKIGGEENVKDVIRFYREGMTIYRLAKNYNTTPYTINRILSDHNII